MRPLWLVIWLIGSAARLGWTQQVGIDSPKAGGPRFSAFPPLSGGAKSSDVGVRISKSGEFWTGAKWQGAAARQSSENPPPNEFLSAVVVKNPSGYWSWGWSLTKDLPEGSNLPDGEYYIWVIVRHTTGTQNTGNHASRSIWIDRHGPQLAIVSPPQTEKPNLGYHHDIEDPYLVGPKGIFPAISGTASDATGPIRVEVFLQRQEDRWWWEGDRWFRRRSSVCKVVIPYGAWRCDSVPPPDSLRAGGYQITVEAIDSLGNRTQTPARRNVVVPFRQLEATKRP